MRREGSKLEAVLIALVFALGVGAARGVAQTPTGQTALGGDLRRLAPPKLVTGPPRFDAGIIRRTPPPPPPKVVWTTYEAILHAGAQLPQPPKPKPTPKRLDRFRRAILYSTLFVTSPIWVPALLLNPDQATCPIPGANDGSL